LFISFNVSVCIRRDPYDRCNDGVNLRAVMKERVSTVGAVTSGSNVPVSEAFAS
jgi:hypothetical protein